MWSLGTMAAALGLGNLLVSPAAPGRGAPPAAPGWGTRTREQAGAAHIPPPGLAPSEAPPDRPALISAPLNSHHIAKTGRGWGGREKGKTTSLQVNEAVGLWEVARPFL